ncbi:MAG: tetratricopeptide repeat protein, partial [Candidatus Binatia bacterium]
DYQEAVKWYRLAAAQGYAPAQSSLGLAYEKGQGVPQDYQEAVKWYRLAAAQGNESAQVNLGVMYTDGRGVRQDFVRVHMWFNLAAAALGGDSRDTATKNRDRIASKMTTEQIGTAQEMARRCQESKFRQKSFLGRTIGVSALLHSLCRTWACIASMVARAETSST